MSEEDPCLSLECISSKQASITILTNGTSPSNSDVVHIFKQHGVRVEITPTTPPSPPETWRWETVVVGVVSCLVFSMILIVLLILGVVKCFSNNNRYDIIIIAESRVIPGFFIHKFIYFLPGTWPCPHVSSV